MSEPAGNLVWLSHPRLAATAMSASPAWLWSIDATRLLWANPAGAAIFDAPASAAIRAVSFGARGPAAIQVARLGATLRPDGATQFERLRGLGAGVGGVLTCACSCITLADHTRAILVAATERADDALPLAERVRRLLAQCSEPIAAFSLEGELIHASSAALVRLGGATSLAALGAGALGAEALGAEAIGEAPVAGARRPGPAIGVSTAGPLTVERVDAEAATILLATFGVLRPTGQAAPAAALEAAAREPALAAAGRRAPLRFVWQMDAEQRFTVGSDEFVALMGPATAAALGRPWPELVTELSLDPEGQIALAVMSRDTWSGLCIAWPLGDGTRLMVELSGLPVFDRERIFRGYRGFGICRDAGRLTLLGTGRAEAAAAIAENVVPLRPSSPMVPALSPVERSAFHELTRKLHERLTATAVRLPLPDPDGRHSNLAQAAEGSSPVELPERPQPERPQDQSPPVGAGAPGPRLARAQAEIRELEAILDTAADGVVMLDRQGRILSSNRGAQALFGREPAAFAGRALVELLAPESAPVASDYLHYLLRNGGARGLDHGREVAGRLADGGALTLFMTLGRIGEEGERLCAVFRDLAPFKKAADELSAAKRRAEKASAAKSDFLAKISHEIRTPLNAIIGFSEIMAQERFGPVGNERYRQYLADIQSSGQHLLSLVNDLLDLSKIEAGKLELDFAEVALNPLTQQCVALLAPQANRERIIIRTSLSEKLPPVLADARSVRQIVLNLISNSTKFTGAGGQVIISTTLTDQGEVVLRVRDNGIGMSEKEIALALEPFRQIATTVRSGPAGTGLGLPLTKALAEANRATFRIKSAPNAGTLIEVAFPPSRISAEERRQQ
jgi:PAS domain S-box-containing protein